MKFIRQLDKKERTRRIEKKTAQYIKDQNSEGTLEKEKAPTPYQLNLQRRSDRKPRSSIYHCPIVYTRDVADNDVSLVSSGVKRKSINRAINKIEKLKARNARPRRIRRAKTSLASRRSINDMRKERNNE
jgi:hypothetical protein